MTYKPIVNNVRKVLETRDIGNLSPQTYRFIIGHMGFIAHYDIGGFKAEYADLRLFCTKLQTSEESSDPTHMAAKADWYERRERADVANTIREIVVLSRIHWHEIDLVFGSKERDRELAQATQLAEKYGYRLVDAS